MTTPFQQSGKKVLKKCKECGIYPSIFSKTSIPSPLEILIKQYLFCIKCDFCVEMEEKESFHDLKLKWNKANGLDESDESTWHDWRIPGIGGFP